MARFWCTARASLLRSGATLGMLRAGGYQDRRGKTVRIAALFFGMIAGLFALLAPSALRTDLMPAFLEFWATTSSERMLGTLAWYAVPATALLGGVLATITPGFAALLLLGAAVGWLGIGISVPQLFTYQLLGPAAAAGIGALLAFLAGELEVRRRRLARRSRRIVEEAPEADSESEREAAFRMDPLLMPRQETVTPRHAIPLTLSDVTVTARPAGEAPRRQDRDPPLAPGRRDPGGWSEARRDPSTPAIDLSMRRGDGGLVGDVRDSDARPEPQSRRSVREERRGGGAMIAAMAAVGAVVGVGILAAGGYLLYRDGALDTLFSESPAPVVAAAGDAPGTALPKPPAKLELPATPAQSIAALPAASGTVEPASTAPLRVAAGPAPERYDDPFSYCGAVGTIDYIDQRYVGPAVPDAITRVLPIAASAARDRVRWRCFEGTVLACTSYIGPICDSAPTVIEMREFCERNPNVEQLLAPNGPWSCVDGKPQLPADASWPIDARGFLPQGWVDVPNPGVPG